MKLGEFGAFRQNAQSSAVQHWLTVQAEARSCGGRKRMADPIADACICPPPAQLFSQSQAQRGDQARQLCTTSLHAKRQSNQMGRDERWRVFPAWRGRSGAVARAQPRKFGQKSRLNPPAC